MKKQITLDGAKLKRIAHASDTATRVATALACRERIRHVTDISRLRSQLVRDGEKIVPEDYIKFWREIQGVGVGQLSLGRKGKPHRFTWHYSLKQVAKSMIEGTDERVERILSSKEEEKPLETQEEPKARKKVKTVIRKASTDAKPIKVTTSESADRSTVEPRSTMTPPSQRLTMLLGKDRAVEVKAPVNITQEEIDALTSALRNLST